MPDKIIEAAKIENIIALFGSFDENVKLIERKCNVKIINRDAQIKVSGDKGDVDIACRVVDSLLKMAGRNEAITEQSINYIMDMVRENKEKDVDSLSEDVIGQTAKGAPIKPKTLGQKEYVKAIKENTITIGVGPAGTGKTYLAVAMAVSAFKKKEVNRIILTRPAVEAGESLGFLPGDLQEKVDPYLRPLYDALYEMLGAENFLSYKEKGMIEVAPLAYMRGRTIDSSFIILDEAQNTSKEQMKMFLTRIGFGSKAVITGDITQIDLPRGKTSGLRDAVKVVKNIEGISIFNLTDRDVVRHPLIQKIIRAYARHEDAQERRKHERR